MAKGPGALTLPGLSEDQRAGAEPHTSNGQGTAHGQHFAAPVRVTRLEIDRDAHGPGRVPARAARLASAFASRCSARCVSRWWWSVMRPEHNELEFAPGIESRARQSPVDAAVPFWVTADGVRR